jgi:hypothetical protein
LLTRPTTRMHSASAAGSSMRQRHGGSEHDHAGLRIKVSRPQTAPLPRAI